MTQDELVARYQVIRDVSEGSPGPFRTLLAWPRDGEKVMIHFLEGPAEDDARVFALIDRLGPADRDVVLERLEVDGQPVVITKFLDKRRTLKQWLEATIDFAPAPEPGTIDRVSGPSAEARDPSADLTVVFEPRARAGRPPMPAAAPSPVLQDRDPAPIQAPGEFTQLFGPPPSSSPPVVPKGPDLRPVPKAPEPRPVPRGPHLWAVQKGPEQRAVPEPRELKPEPQGDPPGELTRVFEGVVPKRPDSGAVAKDPERRAVPEPPKPQPEPQVEAPGEMTRLFEGVVAKGPERPAVSEPPKPEPRGAAPGELTRLFERYVPTDPPAQVRNRPMLEPEPEPRRIDWLGSEVAEGPLFKSDPAPSRPVGDVDYLDRLAAPPRGARPPNSGLPAGPPPVNLTPDPFGVGEYRPLPAPVRPSLDPAPDDSAAASQPGGKAGYLIGLAVVVVVAVVLLIVLLAR